MFLYIKLLDLKVSACDEEDGPGYRAILLVRSDRSNRPEAPARVADAWLVCGRARALRRTQEPGGHSKSPALRLA